MKLQQEQCWRARKGEAGTHLEGLSAFSSSVISKLILSTSLNNTINWAIVLLSLQSNPKCPVNTVTFLPHFWVSQFNLLFQAVIRDDLVIKTSSVSAIYIQQESSATESWFIPICTTCHRSAELGSSVFSRLRMQSPKVQNTPNNTCHSSCKWQISTPKYVLLKLILLQNIHCWQMSSFSSVHSENTFSYKYSFYGEN